MSERAFTRTWHLVCSDCDRSWKIPFNKENDGPGIWRCGNCDKFGATQKVERVYKEVE